MRDLPYPSLNEYNEAVTTVMGFGDDILLQIIKEELIISNRLGSVPDDVPKVPLLVDVEKIQKRLRVPFTSASRMIWSEVSSSIACNCWASTGLSSDG